MKMVISLATLALTLLFVVGCSPSETAKDDFPEKLKVRLELTESDDAVETRIIQYSDNGEKLIQIRTEFRDGSTVINYFRDDGTLREEAEYFPKEAPEVTGNSNTQNTSPKDPNDTSGSDVDIEPTRILKRVSLYESDGKTLISKKTFRSDTTPESEMRIRIDGHRETEHFSSDGKHIVMRVLENTDGDEYLKETFSDEGVLEKVAKRIDKYETHVVVYRSDGVTRKSLTILKKKRSDPYGYGYGYGYGSRNPTLEDDYPEYIEYNPDGISVKMRVSYDNSSTTVEYFDRNGALVEEREYSDYNRLTVKHYWPNGEVRYEQLWRSPSYNYGPRMEIDDYKLESIEENDINGDPTREIEFRENGNPEIEKVFDGKNSYSGVHRYYDEDGNLEKEVDVYNWNDKGEPRYFGKKKAEIEAAKRAAEEAARKKAEEEAAKKAEEEAAKKKAEEEAAKKKAEDDAQKSTEPEIDLDANAASVTLVKPNAKTASLIEATNEPAEIVIEEIKLDIPAEMLKLKDRPLPPKESDLPKSDLKTTSKPAPPYDPYYPYGP